MAEFWLNFGWILTEFWLNFDWILAEFWLHFDCILTAFWLHFDCILTAFWQHFDCILTAFWLHFGCILTEFFWIMKQKHPLQSLSNTRKTKNLSLYRIDGPFTSRSRQLWDQVLFKVGVSTCKMTLRYANLERRLQSMTFDKWVGIKYLELNLLMV